MMNSSAPLYSVCFTPRSFDRYDDEYTVLTDTENLPEDFDGVETVSFDDAAPSQQERSNPTQALMQPSASEETTDDNNLIDESFRLQKLADFVRRMPFKHNTKDSSNIRGNNEQDMTHLQLQKLSIHSKLDLSEITGKTSLESSVTDGDRAVESPHGTIQRDMTDTFISIQKQQEFRSSCTS
mmetsp:Transcript_14906/g.31608  ORF Transcript_14906/g.31608 Transcript_14906/m.31608 type:complete len:182 (+) Transcript_14906:61-606(+)